MMYSRRDVEEIIKEKAEGEDVYLKAEVINEALEERFDRLWILNENILGAEAEIKTVLEEVDLLSNEGIRLYNSWYGGEVEL